MREGLFALLTAAAVSVAVIPRAVGAISEEGGEYLARLGTGSLYVYYTEADKPAAEENSAEDSLFESAEGYLQESEERGEVSADGAAEAESAVIPPDAIAVQAVNLSRQEVTDLPALLLANETGYSVNLDSIVSESLHIEGGAVLIIHTHGTEAYLPEGREYYSADEDFRSTDIAENVVAVGEEFAAALRTADIKVYHDLTMYDEHSYSNAYTASRSACREWLSAHPEIKYILDIHRDSVTDSEGVNQKPLCTVSGEKVAQVMLVIGTDEAGASHGGWRTNLAVGAKYQQLLNEHPTFARPIYLRRASYNQQLSSGAMLLEIGSAANTIEEARAAARLAAEAFVKLYNSLS